MYSYKKLTLILLNSLTLNVYGCGEIAPNMPLMPVTSMQSLYQTLVNPQNPPEQEFESDIRLQIQALTGEQAIHSSGLILKKGGLSA